ncbi:MAG: hypothetical protein HYV63_30260 [Candidatus Schekmanbacteria bacterium]|nr:hypothetical protein [Candidatus Schekmanbacteria bacterium]
MENQKAPETEAAANRHPHLPPLARGGRGGLLMVLLAAAAVAGAVAPSPLAWMSISLAPPPSGGYAPKDAVFWADAVLLEGRVKARSPWWVEVCACDPGAGDCAVLDEMWARPYEMRRLEAVDAGLEESLAERCDPIPGLGLAGAAAGVALSGLRHASGG